jgi:hypothetical protein
MRFEQSWFTYGGVVGDQLAEAKLTRLADGLAAIAFLDAVSLVLAWEASAKVGPVNYS